MDSVLAVSVIVVLIALNGLYVAAEFAIVGAPRLAIERRAREGERIARAVHRILENPREQDRFIATAQLGITFASLGLGMYGEHIVADWIAAGFETVGAAAWVSAPAVATITAVIVLTYFHIVIGEMVPKSLALQRAERTVLWITPPMLWTKALLYPIVVVLNGIGNAVLGLLRAGRQPATHERYYTPEELDLVVRESEEAGALPAGSGRLMHEIFEFGDLTAGQVMTPRVHVTGLPLGSSRGQLEEALRAAPHTRYPVFKDDLDEVIGIVHIKDLLRLILAQEQLGEAHARPIPAVPETASLDAVLTMMRRDRTQIALVLDEHGGMAGIVTLQDLFEEVVGRVDEPTPGSVHIRVDETGCLRVPGTARLEEVGERLGLELRHDDVESVSGLVLTLLGRPPRLGDSVRYAGLRFQVTAVRGLGVAESTVERVPQ